MTKTNNKVEWIIKEFNELNIYELYEILKLRNEIFIVEQQCIYQDIDEKDKNSYHIFSMENNEICSYVRVLKPLTRYKEASIGRVITKKSHRKRGLGKTNLILALDFMKISLKESTVRISAQEHLMDFYGLLGFKKVSESYLEDGIPHIEMLLNLSTWKPTR